MCLMIVTDRRSVSGAPRVTKYSWNPFGKLSNGNNDGETNQALGLFFPVFIAFLLSILSMLSSPIIKGMHVVRVGIKLDEKVNEKWGSLLLGSWGWCIEDVIGVDNQCSSYQRPMMFSMTDVLEQLPKQLESLKSINKAIPTSFLAASDVFHLISCIIGYLTLCTALSATGEWVRRGPKAWKWTRNAFVTTGVYGVSSVIGMALDAGMVGNVAKMAQAPEGAVLHVTPGPTLFLRLVTALLCGLSLASWLTQGMYRPKPSWLNGGTASRSTVIYNNDPYPAPPLSAALPPHDEMPPSWSAHQQYQTPVTDEKEALRSEDDLKKHDFAPLGRQGRF